MTFQPSTLNRPPRRCCHLVRDDSFGQPRACGLPATHRSLRSYWLSFCGDHAAQIERETKGKFQLTRLPEETAA